MFSTSSVKLSCESPAVPSLTHLLPGAALSSCLSAAYKAAKGSCSVSSLHWSSEMEKAAQCPQAEPLPHTQAPHAAATLLLGKPQEAQNANAPEKPPNSSLQHLQPVVVDQTSRTTLSVLILRIKPCHTE